MTKKFLFVVIVILALIQFLFYCSIAFKNKKEPNVELESPIREVVVNITQPKPEYLDYKELIEILEQWNQEAPDLTELSTYGKSSKNKNLYYLKVSDETSNANKKVVLLTACIHGNEPLSTSTMMWYIGNILNSYNHNQEIKQILKTREIYFIPVVSPDTYPNSRHVDGVDPNRNFPGPSNPDQKSIAPVAALRQFFLQIRPKAVLSGHTYGRVFLTPHGDTMQLCNDHEKFVSIVGEMAKLSKYKSIRACQLYGGSSNSNVAPIRVYGEDVSGHTVKMPIYGTEIDWYYRTGSFAVVMEFGTHQRKPTLKEIEYEYERTNDAFIYFLKEAPLVNINSETTAAMPKPKNMIENFGDE